MRHSIIAMALVLAGCSSVADLRRDAKAPVAAPSADTVQAAQLNSYINAMSQLVQGSPAEQAELIAGARAAYDPARPGPGALRYGLMLATPNHPAHDAPQAQRLLREALSRPEMLSVTERALAIVELQRVESELRATAEVERLTGEVQRERDRQRNTVSSPNLAKRLQTEMDENARLRKALDEARAKLDAIANIERSISDRPPATEGRTQ
jgi:cell division septum initiation protein DivIVA